jgi:small GTP-binding protein
MVPRKIMLLGDIGVGKSSIARRFVFDAFEETYRPTLGVDIYTQEVPPSTAQANGAAKLIIWDTDGNLGNTILSLVYMRNAAAAFVVGDRTRPATLETMVELGKQFLEAQPGSYCAFLLNKCDVPGTLNELPAPVLQSGIPTIPTSAKTGENIRHAFLAAADAIKRRSV